MSSKRAGFSLPCRGALNVGKSCRNPAAFAAVSGPAKARKPPERGGLPWLSKSASEAPRLEPFGVAAATIAARTAISIATGIPIATAIHAVLEAATSPTFAAEPARPVREDGEAALLAVVQGLVERVSCIGDLLHRRCRGRHVVGAFAKAADRIARVLRILLLRIILPGAGLRIGAIDPEFCELPHRALDRRPQLFLVGAQLQSGVDGRDPRVGKGGPVLGAHARMSHVLMKPPMMLGIDRRRPGDGEHSDAGDSKLPHVNLLRKVVQG